MTEEIDSGMMAVMKALWIQNQAQVESTHNELFKLTKQFRDMAKQTFSNKIKKLIDEGHVECEPKKNSKMHFKPKIYKLSKKGLQVVSLRVALIEYKQKQDEEANGMSIEELYRRLCRQTFLAASSAPIFILLGHENFMGTYIYDMATTWIRIIEKRMRADMEEALKTVLPLALALTVEIGQERLPASLIEDIKEGISQWNLDPDEVFNKSEKLRGELAGWLSYLED